MKRAFTLIELLMVIAIIGIISTLAVSKVGGIREASARKVSLANQLAVERAVEAFLTNGGRLNRLDALVSTRGDGVTCWKHGAAGFDCAHTNFTASMQELYLGPSRAAGGIAAEALEEFRGEYNAGLTPGLMRVLCPYTLSPAQVEALTTRLGLRHVMAHNEFPCNPAASDAYGNRPCGDGSYVESIGDGRNPNESACIPIAVTNDMTVLAVSPVVERGREIYRAFGQDLPKSEERESGYREASAVAEVTATGGPLLAFGLGERCSAIGTANAGLETAPSATYPVSKFYSRYILLIRLRTAGTAILPEFAGVIDPCGNTVRSAREILRAL